MVSHISREINVHECFSFFSEFDDHLSARDAAVIASATTFLLSISVGVFLGCCVCYFMRRHQNAIKDPQQKKEQSQESIYEEPPDTVIPLNENQAYGQVNIH